MAKKKEENKFGDIVENHELIKRTLMVAAFPALIKEVKKEGSTFYNGFLPGFEFASVEDIADEDEMVETLQDMLDDEVEELVVFGKSLPYVEEDEELMEKYPEHKIVYLDINVYATPEELEYYDACSHDCSCCSHDCGGHDLDDCDDEECDCDHEHHHSHCDCGCEDEDCDCDDDCDCGCHEHEHCNCDDECNDDCGCHEHNHCDCNDKKEDKDCCGKGKKEGKCSKGHECDGSKKGKGIHCKDKKSK